MSERPGNTFLLAAALSLAGFALAAVIEVAPSFAHATHSMPSMDRTIDRSFDLGGVRVLRVRASSSDLRIAHGEPASDALALHGTLSSFDSRALSQFAITFVRDGDVATLTLIEPNDSNFVQNKFTLALAPSAARSLDVATSSGDVIVEGPGAPATVRTDNGDVTVSDASSTLDLQTSSGDIEVARAGGRIAAHTSNGDVTIRGAKGALSLVSSSGDIVAMLDPAWSADSIAIDSSSGDVDLHVPQNLRASLTIATSSGDVSNGAGLPSTAPGAPSISVQTSSGDVKVAKLQ